MKLFNGAIDASGRENKASKKVVDPRRRVSLPNIESGRIRTNTPNTIQESRSFSVHTRADKAQPHGKNNLEEYVKNAVGCKRPFSHPTRGQIVYIRVDFDRNYSRSRDGRHTCSSASLQRGQMGKAQGPSICHLG